MHSNRYRGELPLWLSYRSQKLNFLKCGCSLLHLHAFTIVPLLNSDIVCTVIDVGVGWGQAGPLCS